MYSNVRGLSTPNKQKEIKLLFGKENIDFAGLVKTKIKETKHRKGGKRFVWRMRIYYKFFRPL